MKAGAVQFARMIQKVKHVLFEVCAVFTGGLVGDDEEFEVYLRVVAHLMGDPGWDVDRLAGF